MSESQRCPVHTAAHMLLFFTSVYIIIGFLKPDCDTEKKKKRPSYQPPSSRSISSTNNSVGIIYPHEHERKMENRLKDDCWDELQDAPQERRKVVVRVPATSANLGPGFDAIGMAVDMWSEYTVERSDKFEIICEGEGSQDMPLDESNLVCFGLIAAFEKAGKPVPPLKYILNNKIPYARGLGSSSAAIVGGLVAGLVLAGHQVRMAVRFK